MKKACKIILLVAIASICWACREQHVFHTHYGDIDTDTMFAITDTDGSDYYLINAEMMDSNIAAAMQLEGMYMVIFYNPSKDSYFRKIYGSDGGESARVYFDPESGETDSIR